MPIDPVSYKDQNIIRPEVWVPEKSEIDKKNHLLLNETFLSQKTVVLWITLRNADKIVLVHGFTKTYYSWLLSVHNSRPILKISTRSENKYKSQYSTAKSGPNVTLRQGPKDSLLLYVLFIWIIVSFSFLICISLNVSSAERYETTTLEKTRAATQFPLRTAAERSYVQWLVARNRNAPSYLYL